MEFIQVGSYSFTWTFLFGMFCVGFGFGMALLTIYAIDKATHSGSKEVPPAQYERPDPGRRKR